MIDEYRFRFIPSEDIKVSEFLVSENDKIPTNSNKNSYFSHSG